MSVLLDALKKAALEKQKREGLTSSVGEGKNTSEQTVANPMHTDDHETPKTAATESAALTKLELVDTSTESNESAHDSDQSEPQASQSSQTQDEQREHYSQQESEAVESTFYSDDHEFIADAAVKNVEVNDSNSSVNEDANEAAIPENSSHDTEIEMIVELDDDVLNPQQTESNAELPAHASHDEPDDLAQAPDASDTQSAEIEDKTDTLIEENSSAVNAQPQSTPAPMSDADLKELLSNVAIDDDLVNQIENPQETAQDQRRVSFQRLLDKNREDAKKRKFRFLILYVVVIIVAALVVASYFFYINSQSQQLIPAQTTSYVDVASPEDDGDELQAEEDASGSESLLAEPLSEQSEISEGVVTQQPADLANTPSGLKGAAASASTQSVTNETIQSHDAVAPSKTDVRQDLDDGGPIRSSLVPHVKQEASQHQSVVEPSHNIITKGKLKSKPVGENIAVAYQAYQQGDFARAAEFYRRALIADPYHRDALLGSAAVAVAQQRYQAAIGFYQAQLNRRPDDDIANAGLLALAAVEGATPDILSKVNQLLADNPNAAHLYFLKGSLFARQKQWDAAQQAFFSAWSIESERADYTYNLAIALDHLRQYKQALRFYRLTLQLPTINISSRQISQLNHRISQLEVLDE
ncbi:hypothetical protein TDB9533_03954 [Thalassocella blandensis]|nr:hypothetical protein TDB9533_03954 [Thalassocella blandensis]